MWLYKLKTWLHNLSKQKQDIETTIGLLLWWVSCSATGKWWAKSFGKGVVLNFQLSDLPREGKRREGKGREGKGREGKRWREVLGSHFTMNSCNPHIMKYNMLYVSGSPNIPSHILSVPAAPQYRWSSVKGGAHMHFVDKENYDCPMCLSMKFVWALSSYCIIKYMQCALKIQNGISATCICSRFYLVVLVCCDSSELCAWKDERVKVVPVQVFGILWLHNVQSRLVSVHTVHYDLLGSGKGHAEWAASLLIESANIWGCEIFSTELRGS